MKINPLVIYREEFDKSAVLFRPDTGESYMLNRTASFIWKQLETGASKEEIRKALGEACGPLPAGANRDLDDFLAKLLKKGYLAE